jgi:hypothetical protein
MGWAPPTSASKAPAEAEVFDLRGLEALDGMDSVLKDGAPLLDEIMLNGLLSLVRTRPGKPSLTPGG